MISRLLSDTGSVPDLIIGAAIILIAVFIGLKLVGTVAKLLVLLLVGVGIYVWVS